MGATASGSDGSSPLMAHICGKDSGKIEELRLDGGSSHPLSTSLPASLSTSIPLSLSTSPPVSLSTCLPLFPVRPHTRPRTQRRPPTVTLLPTWCSRSKRPLDPRT